MLQNFEIETKVMGIHCVVCCKYEFLSEPDEEGFTDFDWHIDAVFNQDTQQNMTPDEVAEFVSLNYSEFEKVVFNEAEKIWKR